MFSSLWGMIGNMPWTVRLLGGVLLVMSVASWALIMKKHTRLSAVKRQFSDFEKLFWSGGDLEGLFSKLSLHRKASPINAMFCAGYDILTEMEEAGGDYGDIAKVKDAMGIQMRKWELSVQNDLTWLATIASISPYLGLLGTVFGVMHTFQGLLSVNTQATLQAVAPGISEALGMTALGLAVAIPATIAYNRYTVWVDDLVSSFQIFQDEFLLLLQKQAK